MTYRIALSSVSLMLYALCVSAAEPETTLSLSDEGTPAMTVSVGGGGKACQGDKAAGGCESNPCGDCNDCGTCGRGGHCRSCGALGHGCDENGCCFNTCNMPQHHIYFPTDHGYYYFRPYNYKTIRIQQQAVTRYGGDPRNPYSNLILKGIYVGMDETPAPQTDATEAVEPAPVEDSAPVLPPTPVDPPVETPAVDADASANRTGCRLDLSDLNGELQIIDQQGTLELVENVSEVEEAPLDVAQTTVAPKVVAAPMLQLGTLQPVDSTEASEQEDRGSVLTSFEKTAEVPAQDE